MAKKASLERVGPPVWVVLTADAKVLGRFPSRGDVYALVRRIPMLSVVREQAYSFVEHDGPNDDEGATKNDGA